MNTWSYDVLSAWGQFPLETIIRMALESTAARGYSQINPWSGLVEGIYPAGYPGFALQSVEDMTSLLAQDGGLVELWKDASGATLSFTRVRRRSKSGAGAAGGQTNLFLVASLGIEMAEWRPDTVERQIIADDAEHIFAELCSVLSSPYGFSMDEDAFEELRLEPDFLGNIDLQKPPENLFWLQYLSRSYAEQIDFTVLEKLGAKIEQNGDGMLVRFFDAPWLVDLSQLVKINQHWKQSVLSL
jgi:hypothetical protein